RKPFLLCGRLRSPSGNLRRPLPGRPFRAANIYPRYATGERLFFAPALDYPPKLIGDDKAPVQATLRTACHSVVFSLPDWRALTAWPVPFLFRSAVACLAGFFP